jgi:hypothetical protein
VLFLFVLALFFVMLVMLFVVVHFSSCCVSYYIRAA